MSDEVREQLAEYAHQAWSGWMAYMFAQCEMFPDGSILIHPGYVTALQKLIDTPYADLSEGQKDNDRKEADRMIAIFEAAKP